MLHALVVVVLTLLAASHGSQSAASTKDSTVKTTNGRQLHNGVLPCDSGQVCSDFAEKRCVCVCFCRFVSGPPKPPKATPGVPPPTDSRRLPVLHPVAIKFCVKSCRLACGALSLGVSRSLP